MSQKQVVVVGGSVTGLGTALALTQDGHRVTVVEADSTPLLSSPAEAFEHWERRGSPQVRHSHAFLARLIQILLQKAPDLLGALVDAGAEVLDLESLLPETIEDRSPEPGDEDLALLACGRITFEWVTRRFVSRSVELDLASDVGSGAVETGAPEKLAVGVKGHREEVAADIGGHDGAAGRRHGNRMHVAETRG